MKESCAAIAGAIHELELELEQRQQALNLLRQALRLMEGVPSPVSSAPPSVPAKDGLSVRLDAFLASLQDGDGFTVDDVMEAMAASGMEKTDGLRSKISSLLGRRVKNKSIERVGARGSYAKPDKDYDEPA